MSDCLIHQAVAVQCSGGPVGSKTRAETRQSHACFPTTIQNLLPDSALRFASFSRKFQPFSCIFIFMLQNILLYVIFYDLGGPVPNVAFQ